MNQSNNAGFLIMAAIGLTETEMLTKQNVESEDWLNMFILKSQRWIWTLSSV